MSIRKKVSPKAKAVVGITALVIGASALSGCATQGVRSFEFSFLNGRYGTRGQQKMGKDAPELKQEIFSSDSQVQPYATKEYRQYPPSPKYSGMKGAYNGK